MMKQGGQGIPFNQAHQAYQSWYNSNHPNSSGQKNRKEFQAFMDEKFKTKSLGGRNKVYIGIKLREK